VVFDGACIIARTSVAVAANNDGHLHIPKHLVFSWYWKLRSEEVSTSEVPHINPSSPSSRALPCNILEYFIAFQVLLSMGRHYCENCEVLLEDSGNVPWTSCQNSNCPASGRQVCCRCADTEKPVCSYCDNSCSMCWLAGPHILVPGLDNYQSGLAEECECEDCPVTSLLSVEDRCFSCFESAVSDEFGCDVWNEHETWTIKECGHNVCEALQMEMSCAKGECSMCKSKQKYETKKKEQETEAAKVQSDVSIMKECLTRVESESARSAIETWLKDHSPNKKPRNK
jgi:hypothetical protein